MNGKHTLQWTLRTLAGCCHSAVARLWAVAVVASLCAVGCGGTAPVDPASEEVDRTSEAIVNGYTLSSEENTSIVAIQVWNTVRNPPAHWSTFCSGGMMTNTILVTAKHCLENPPAGTIYAQMGSQRIALKTPYALNPDWDIAVAKLVSPMAMWNYNNGRFLTNPPKVTTSGYLRTIHTGGNQSLDQSSVMCWGHGGATDANPAPRLTYAPLNTRFHDGYSPTEEVHMVETNNRICQPGDSGMLCLDNLSPYASALAVVSTNYEPVSPPFCSGPGPDSWGAWLTYLVVYG